MLLLPPTITAARIASLFNQLVTEFLSATEFCFKYVTKCISRIVECIYKPQSSLCTLKEIIFIEVYLNIIPQRFSSKLYYIISYMRITV